MDRIGVGLQRTAAALQRTCGAVDRTGGALMRTGGALDRAGVALQRTGYPPDRTGGAKEMSRHVLPLEPAAAHTAGLLILNSALSTRIIAPKEHLRPTGMMFVHTSHWKILFTPYLVVELSPSAKIWWVSVTSINDGTQILTQILRN